MYACMYVCMQIGMYVWFVCMDTCSMKWRLRGYIYMHWHRPLAPCCIAYPRGHIPASRVLIYIYTYMHTHTWIYATAGPLYTNLPCHIFQHLWKGLDDDHEGKTAAVLLHLYVYVCVCAYMREHKTICIHSLKITDNTYTHIHRLSLSLSLSHTHTHIHHAQ